MNFDPQRTLESKATHRRELADLPTGEKLRLLDEMKERTLVILRAVGADDEFALHIAGEVLFGGIDDKGAFVEFLIEAWLEGEERLVGGSDDFSGELVRMHGKRFLTTGRTEYTE